MGAWGSGPFEDDEALDWVSELAASGDPAFCVRTLRAIDGMTVIGRREGVRGIAAAEVVAALRGRSYEPLPDGIGDWMADTGARADGTVRDLALRVVGKIESEDSELRQLWDEMPDDGPSWHASVADLRRRLQARARPTVQRPRRPAVRVGDVVQLVTSAGQLAYIQLAGETEPFGDLIRVLPGLFDRPLDEAGLATLVGDGTEFLVGGFFRDMLGDAASGGAGGQARGNYPLPTAFASPQPLRTGGGRRGWGISFGGVRLSAEEFAARFPDIDQTMLDWWGNQSFPETLLRMIECQWRPWMDPHVKSWMYPEDGNLTDLKRPGRPPVYPATAIPGKFLIDDPADVKAPTSRYSGGLLTST